MDKAHILDEIKRTTAESGGASPGQQGFRRETGIKISDWRGKYWARWSDALLEAGVRPNRLIEPYTEEFLLERYAHLLRELGRFPTHAELTMERRRDSSVPSPGPFARLGRKPVLAARLREYCRIRAGSESIVGLCDAVIRESGGRCEESSAKAETGFVYLLRCGKYYKIGRSNAPGRRERELALLLPQRAMTIHIIRTDDPAGIEAYWHRRFDAKRRNGEWFALSRAEVGAFVRRRFM